MNPHYGTVPNPIALGRMAGGSSGGSAAALAARLADAALGSDSGGSIRIPAACCGVVGFKPTYGLVPIEGCFPLAPSFDHAGPMARSVAECRVIMEALVPGFRQQRLEGLEEVEAGIAWLDGCEPLVRERVAEAAGRFPRRRHIDLPLPNGVGTAFMREVAEVHRELFAEESSRYGANVRTKIEACLAVTDAEYEAALRARAEYRERIAEAAQDVDLLVTPTLAFVAPELPVDDLDVREAVIRLTFPFNVLGWPALALPCGAAEAGVPASVQLVGKAGADDLVLAAGELLEHPSL